TDIFVARFDAAGMHQWSVRAGGTDGDVPIEIAVDGSDHVLVAGWFYGTTDLGGGPFVSSGWEDAFIAKFGEHPLPVLISRFAATPRGSNVQVEWDITSDEPVESFTLYRRESTSSAARVIATGNPLVTRSFTDTSVEVGKTYEFELVIRTVAGDIFRSAPERVTVRALATSLGPNYPNPFNPKTSIEYTLGERMPVTIEIYDVSGSIVTRLEQGLREAGAYRVEWDGRDGAGRSMGSGVYFYRLTNAPGAGARKMILLK
ncbi:MAG TPA: FlgD immunoglobulin-like domain containing protein, partial [Candidatus Krumholzibacteria bacterium]|nr:FlgD immunoglobulin-like domain containing protein [Candidatus Krumholzibacteria bacterium]